jgi:hypothetical protein
MPEKCDNPCTVTIQQCLICEKEICEVYWFVHEQADDEADGVLLDSYGKMMMAARRYGIKLA